MNSEHKVKQFKNKKIMNFKILFLLIFSINICDAQMNPIIITFKNGEKLNGIGKIKSSTIKFKIDESAKAEEFEFSKLKSAEIEIPDEEKVIYKFYQTDISNEYIAVQQIVSGSKVELFTTSFNYRAIGAGGMSFSQSVTHYYIKKTNEEWLTDLGEYSPLTNDLKGKVKSYFSDCISLIEKLEKREFKVRDGLEDIVNFYNKNCE